MKITETVDRECCQAKDLKPYMGKATFDRSRWNPQFCVHCGQVHVTIRKMDAAGSMDTELARIVIHDNGWE